MHQRFEHAFEVRRAQFLEDLGDRSIKARFVVKTPL